MARLRCTSALVVSLPLALLVACAGSRGDVRSASSPGAEPAAAQSAPASDGYRLPPAEVVAIVDAAPTPGFSVSPTGELALHVDRAALPSILELAEPFVPLAGARIHPRRYEQRRTNYARGFALQQISKEGWGIVRTPEGGGLGTPRWSPDGTHFAFTRSIADGVELWVADTRDGKCRRLVGPRLNDVLGASFGWWSGSERLWVRLVPSGQGAPPSAPAVPGGPIVSETAGRTAENRTYQNLLQSPHDEALFEHYGTVQLAVVEVGGRLRELGAPGLYAEVDPAPDGRHLRVERLVGPWSYDVPSSRFARRIEVWDGAGKLLATVAELPVADDVPIGGVSRGPRALAWRDDRPATLVWAEALDGGDPKLKVPHRDRLLELPAPFTAAPRELLRTEQRFSGLRALERPGWMLVDEFDRDRRWRTTRLVRFDEPGVAPRVLFDRSMHDRYGDPGTPVRITRPDGTRPIRVVAGGVLLVGDGAGPDGERPFLDHLELDTLHARRLFESPAEAHTTPVEVLIEGDQPRALVLRRESPTEPPNYQRLELASGESRALTAFPDPHPQLTGIHKELVRYEREDGVPLSGTLYLPPGHVPGTRLPLVVWAYPVEYSDASVAGQVRGTTNRFTRLAGTSPLMFLTQGYAVLDNAAMPVVGDPETMNDTFVEQTVAAARAAIEYLDGRGLVDPERVAVGGHSYGAFMTANLLAHSDLFRAGIARSGAYNRSLTPFGFQSERRKLWEAPEAYVRVSPFFQAHRIDEPILLIHGEVDDNSGTFPIQTQRLYHALQGLGGTARMVLLPHESHGYSARESVLHVLAESIEWLDRHVKHAPRRDVSAARASHTEGA